MNDAATGHGQRQHQRVGWFELFYDLVIVAAVGHGSHVFLEEPTWGMSVWIAASTLVMFLLWLLTVLNNNVYPGDHPVRRLLVLVQMLALVVAALAMAQGEGLPNHVGFIAISVAFGTVAAMYAMAAVRVPAKRADALLIAITSGAGALVLLSGALVPEDHVGDPLGAVPWIVGIGIAIIALPLFVSYVGRLSRGGHVDDEHLGERLGQLVIIVLGESFVSLIATLSGLHSIPNPLFFVLTFVVVFSIWTVYFSSVSPAGVPRTAGRLRTWLLAHWILMFGAIATAGGFSALAVVPFDETGQGHAGHWTPTPLLWVMAALVLLTLLAVPFDRRLVAIHIAATAAIAVLIVLNATAFQGGTSWEIAAAGLVVTADALVCAALIRPYREDD